MVKFCGRAGGGFLIGIGLTRRNLERLLDGEPIAYKIDEHEIPDPHLKGHAILIVAGETEEAILAELTSVAAEAGVSVGPPPKGSA